MNLEILGKTLSDVIVHGDHEIIFKLEDGTQYKMYHNQDCCEHVYIDDLNGDVQDLVGSPLLIAEEISNDLPVKYNGDESFTWTFYRFGTIKGTVDIKWYGSSNGYYSESVDFQKLNSYNEDY